MLLVFHRPPTDLELNSPPPPRPSNSWIILRIVFQVKNEREKLPNRVLILFTQLCAHELNIVESKHTQTY